MACGCGKGGTRQYEVTKGDGSKETVKSLNEAMTMIRRFGGTYRITKT